MGYDHLLHIVSDRRSDAHLRRYFGTQCGPDAPPRYTGGRFEQLGGGGDTPENRGQITATDLIAVQMLSGIVPRQVALDLLEGPLGRQVTKGLRHIPTTVKIGTR